MSFYPLAITGMFGLHASLKSACLPALLFIFSSWYLLFLSLISPRGAPLLERATLSPAPLTHVKHAQRLWHKASVWVRVDSMEENKRENACCPSKAESNFKNEEGHRKLI